MLIDIFNTVFAMKSEEIKRLQPDLVFNSRFLEMGRNTCKDYIDWVNNSETKFFYHENSN